MLIRNFTANAVKANVFHTSESGSVVLETADSTDCSYGFFLYDHKSKNVSVSDVSCANCSGASTVDLGSQAE